MKTTTWMVPATSANLGPGFDALGLALDLFNRTVVRPQAARGVRIEVYGAGEAFLPRDERNLTLQALKLAFRRAGQPLPRGLWIAQENQIAVGSGLGSSAAAVVAGLLAANDLLGGVFSTAKLLEMATEIEGHPDNAAAALYGGLVISVDGLLRRFPLPAWTVVVVTPQVRWPTWRARSVLPRRVNLRAAARNIGRALLVTEALRTHDLELLRQAMKDELHEPYRLPHIPGARQALAGARRLGAAAALSGAGPSLAAFSPPEEAAAIGAAMQNAFAAHDVQAAVSVLRVSNQGARSAA